MEKLYYSITEVSELLGEEPSTLRYWEGQFKELQPKVGSRGVRKYTPKDIELLKAIQLLLRTQGLKIEAAKQKLSEKGDYLTKKANAITRLEHALKELKEIRKELNGNETTMTDIMI